MTTTPTHDTAALAAEQPAVTRAAVFHQIRLAVYRLAMPTFDPERLVLRELVTRPPLLTELRSAIRPDQGGSGAGGSAPNTRIGFDAGAYDLFVEVTRQIASAYESATDRRPTETPELLILEWFIELEAMGRIKDGLTDAQLLAQLDRVRQWLRRIEDHFDPPRTADVPGAKCIECQAELGAVTLNGHLVPAPAIFWTKSPRRGLLVECRVCGETWTRDDLDLRDRFKWAVRREERTHDLTNPLSGDDWHHIRLDLRERRRHTNTLWPAAARGRTAPAPTEQEPS